MKLWLLVLLAGSVTCAGGEQRGPSLASVGDRESSLPGSYACMIELPFRPTTPERCAISSAAGSLTLESSGVAPLRGTLSTTENGFRFRGELACVGRHCPLPIETEFIADEGLSGSYSAIAALETGGLVRIQIRRD